MLFECLIDTIILLQFSYRREELHPSRRFSMENKYEVTNLPCICGCGSDSCFFPDESAGAVITRLARSQPGSPEPHRTQANSNTISDWSPLDDGIESVLPNGSDRVPSREEVDAYIFGILNKPTTKRRRLPVFAEFCKEH